MAPSFLTSCITNVRTLGTIQQVTITSYECALESDSAQKTSLDALAFWLQAAQYHALDDGFPACSTTEPPRLWIISASLDNEVDMANDAQFGIRSSLPADVLQYGSLPPMKIVARETLSQDRLDNPQGSKRHDGQSDQGAHVVSRESEDYKGLLKSEINHAGLLKVAIHNLLAKKITDCEELLRVGFTEFVRVEPSHSDEDCITLPTIPDHCVSLVTGMHPGGELFATTKTESLSNFSNTYARQVQNTDKATHVLLSPCGVLGSIPSYKHHVPDIDSLTENDNLPAILNGWSSEAAMMWKELVKEWLCHRGVRAPSADDEAEWTRLELGTSTRHMTGHNTKLTGPTKIGVLWPTSLCMTLGRDHAQEVLRSSKLAEATKPTEYTDTSCHSDPIEFATDWLARDDLDQLLEDSYLFQRRREHQANSLNDTIMDDIAPATSALGLKNASFHGRKDREDAISNHTDLRSTLTPGLNRHLLPITPTMLGSNAHCGREDSGVTEEDFDFFDEGSSPPSMEVSAKTRSVTRDRSTIEDSSNTREEIDLVTPTGVIEQKPMQTNADAAPPSSDLIDMALVPSLFDDGTGLSRSHDSSPITNLPMVDTTDTSKTSYTAIEVSNHAKTRLRGTDPTDLAFQIARNDLKYSRRGRFVPDGHKAHDHEAKPEKASEADQIPRIGRPPSRGGSASESASTVSDSDESSFVAHSGATERSSGHTDITMHGSTNAQSMPQIVNGDLLRHEFQRILNDHFETNTFRYPRDSLSERLMTEVPDSTFIEGTDILNQDLVDIAQITYEESCTPQSMLANAGTRPLSGLMNLSSSCLDLIGPLPLSLHTYLHDEAKGLSELSELATDLAMPYVQVGRMESAWEVLPTALSFWNALSFTPLHGSKDVLALCIFPEIFVSRSCVLRFLDQMKAAYTKDKLGEFSVVQLVKAEPGLVPVTQNADHGIAALSSAFFDTCKETGEALATSSRQYTNHNIVLYLINPFPSSSFIPQLCASFLAFTKALTATLKTRGDCHRYVVPKIIPMSLVKASTGLVFLELPVASKIAHDNYNSFPMTCHEAHRAELPILGAASTELVQGPKPDIGFRLSTVVSASILQDPSDIHVAYCHSINGLWVTAAWTDITGRYQHKAAYSKQNRTFPEIAHEIWGTTLYITAPRKTRWRIFVTCAGALSPTQQETWIGVFMSSPKERRRHLSPVLLAVDTSPALQLHPRPHSIESPEATPGARDPTSPASTPSAAPSPFNIVSTPSKEQGSAIATPADSDASAHLTYAANEAWSIVLPKALDVAQTALCINYALSSGFLIKRSGPNAHDPPVLLGVSVMYISTSGEEQQDSTNGALSQPHTKHKRLLKQIIAMYRKLAVLAEIRGLQDETKTLPWHVAVAEKGAAALIALS